MVVKDTCDHSMSPTHGDYLKDISIKLNYNIKRTSQFSCKVKISANLKPPSEVPYVEKSSD